MAQKRGSISKRLGLENVKPLTKKACLDKVRTLKVGINKGRYSGKLLDYARYYRSWYAWKSTHLKRKAA